jgi:hypothetical protein
VTVPISVVIPVWRDTARLVRLLDDLPRRPDVQIIVAATAVECSELQEAAAGWSDVLVASGRIGRGGQRNAGARMASGGVLLFLHVDSELWKGSAGPEKGSSVNSRGTRA